MLSKFKPSKPSKPAKSKCCSTMFALHKLPQQLALRTPKRRNVFSNAAAATASGLAPRRLLVERTEVPEQPMTTYRT